MDGSIDPHVVEHDKATLAHVVQQVLGRNDADVTSWRSTSLMPWHHGNARWRVPILAGRRRRDEKIVDPGALRIGRAAVGLLQCCIPHGNAVADLAVVEPGVRA